MKYTVQISEFRDKKGYTHRKCTITLPYEDLRDAGLIGTSKERRATVDYDMVTKRFTIEKTDK